MPSRTPQQRALSAPQEEAAAAMSLANEARAQARVLTDMRQQEEQLRGGGGGSLGAEPSLGSLDGGEAAGELSARLAAQQAELERLEEELRGANARRAELAKVITDESGGGGVDRGRSCCVSDDFGTLTSHSQLIVFARHTTLPSTPQANADLEQRLSDAERRAREASAVAGSLQLQLAATREAAASKDRVIEQVSSPLPRSRSVLSKPYVCPPRNANSAASPIHPLPRSNPTPAVKQYKAACDADQGSSGAPGSPSSARRSPGREGGSRSLAGSQGGAISHTKIERVTTAWREAGRLKDLKTEELSFQLGQVRGKRGGRCKERRGELLASLQNGSHLHILVTYTSCNPLPAPVQATVQLEHLRRETAALSQQLVESQVRGRRVEEREETGTRWR
jgi:hypothetical protein